MSRLIIKNLPSYVTPARLREHFEQKKGPGGTITDVKVALKPNGTSRRFGFVGYMTEKEATAARDWFDKTFVDSTRITVALVDGFKDAPAARPNKRLRLDSSQTDVAASPSQISANPKSSSKIDVPKKKSDDQLEEFMQVMQPRTKKGPSWANDPLPVDAGASTSVKKSKIHEMEDKKSARVDTPNQESTTDLDWMRQRISKALDLEDDAEKVYEQSDDENSDPKLDQPSVEELPPPTDVNKDIILKTSRLFLRNLAFLCSETDLTNLFDRFGEISQVHIPIDPVTKQSKGMAYVSFAQATSALAAYEALDKTSFQGRLLHILPAVDRKGNVRIEDRAKKSLKETRNMNRKTTAGRDFNWSMLYMNSDAVVSSIADRMNIPKADILNPESDNAAVKLALAETHIIQETKSYLESQGVILSSFSSRARSDTIILVKNIPYGTTSEQIIELFEPHGKLSRVLVPPAGTMAVVEFIHSDEARKAFGAIAYRRLGNSVIYLAQGPLGMFQDDSVDGSQPSITTATASKPITIPEQHANVAELENATVPGSTLFVKNLSFSTSTERLTQIFRHLPSFAFARVQTKPDPKRPGQDAPQLSAGYGFVGFKTVDAAKKALKSMQGHVLDGHALHVKFANRGAEDESKEKVVAKSRTTKMIVKNVPFEASKKDIRELFGAHGQLKSVRLPKKFDSRSRGFAFLEFTSRTEAENAFTALRHTHLLGRHLVLEWAKEDEPDLDALRRKAGIGYGDGAEMPGRKRKLDLDLDTANDEDD